MPTNNGSPSHGGGGGGGGGGANIDKLDYHPGGALLRPNDGGETSGRPSAEHSYAGSFFEQVAEGIVDRDRAKMTREVVRYISFGWAILNWYVKQVISNRVLSYPMSLALFPQKLSQREREAGRLVKTRG